jgi:hypothetical protein
MPPHMNYPDLASYIVKKCINFKIKINIRLLTLGQDNTTNT